MLRRMLRRPAVHSSWRRVVTCHAPHAVLCHAPHAALCHAPHAVLLHPSRPPPTPQVASDSVAAKLGVRGGALLQSVVPGGAAAAAGLLATRRGLAGVIPGDTILAVGGARRLRLLTALSARRPSCMCCMRDATADPPTHPRPDQWAAGAQQRRAAGRPGALLRGRDRHAARRAGRGGRRRAGGGGCGGHAAARVRDGEALAAREAGEWMCGRAEQGGGVMGRPWLGEGWSPAGRLLGAGKGAGASGSGATMSTSGSTKTSARPACISPLITQ